MKHDGVGRLVRNEAQGDVLQVESFFATSRRRTVDPIVGQGAIQVCERGSNLVKTARVQFQENVDLSRIQRNGGSGEDFRECGLSAASDDAGPPALRPEMQLVHSHEGLQASLAGCEAARGIDLVPTPIAQLLIVKGDGVLRRGGDYDAVCHAIQSMGELRGDSSGQRLLKLRKKRRSLWIASQLGGHPRRFDDGEFVTRLQQDRNAQRRSIDSEVHAPSVRARAGGVQF